MASFSLSGLSSGFDWSSFIDQIVAAEQIGITKLETEKATNTRKSSSLTSLGTMITEMQTAAKALATDGLFGGRTASSTTANSKWSISASASTATGSYDFAISRLATRATLAGSSSISNPLSATDDVSGLTLASLRTASAVTAGDFTVNGKKVTIAVTDSLQDVFDKISTATSGAVTASYTSGTDRISLSSSSEIVLGASNDTSNFLTVARLANNGTNSISSSGSLGAAGLNTTLASSPLRNAITAVDGAGDGSFLINGKTIAFNVNTDTLSSVLKKINDSGAGVTAAYDASTDSVKLTNSATGDLGLGVSDVSGGFLDAVGLLSGTSLTRGQNAQFTVNGGATLTSTSNTLTADVHGITGLSVSATTQTTETVTVTANTEAMRSKIDAFVTKFNAVQNYIEEQTKITKGSNGKVTTSLLTSNREIQSWSSNLRSLAFGAVSGLSGTISRLNDLGIDFTTGTSQLSVVDESKLSSALENDADDVAAFFNTASTGFAAKFDDFAKKVMGSTGTGTDGWLATQTQTINNQNESIDDQIAQIERRIESEKSRLTASFTAMEEANARIKTMQQQLSSAFSTSSSTSSS